MQGTEIFGYLGALLTLATFSMKTMVRLRMVGIAANVAFATYGLMGHVWPVLILHCTLLPLNSWRLHQVLRLSRSLQDASSARLSVEWLKPFTRQRRLRAGERLFGRGDLADEMLFVLTGRFRAQEAGVLMGPGEVFGELGLLLRGNRRSQTVVCEEPGELLVISYDEVRQLYFQNPKFGFFFLELAAERLARDATRAGGAAPATPLEPVPVKP